MMTQARISPNIEEPCPDFTQVLLEFYKAATVDYVWIVAYHNDQCPASPAQRGRGPCNCRVAERQARIETATAALRKMMHVL